MKTLRTILRSFVLGAIAGVLIAPRAGRDTRQMLSDKWNSLLDGTPGMNFGDSSNTSNQS